ncbi:MAG TPA: hypothetical protein VGS57_20220 [Thermoanaerobaculia bacterium]|nr:hypothetical protein [Thermoanaerobaculia bacterium]
MIELRPEPAPTPVRADRRSSESRFRFAAPLALLLTFAMALPAVAQYRPAGADLEAPTDRKDELQKAMEQARWHLGSIRVAPWIGLRSLDYVRELDSNGRQQKGDVTLTAGAGLKAYLPLGTHGVATAHAVPEYTWWQRQDERNSAVGHYGLGLFAWLNRLEGEVTARRAEDSSFLSSDLLVREPIRIDEVAVKAQVRVLGSIAVFTGAHSSRTRVEATSSLEATDPALALDRDAAEVRAGLRYLLRGKRGYLGGGVLKERTEFQAADTARSNEGSSWYAEALLRGNHADAQVQYDQRDLEPDGSTFPGYSAANGMASLTLHPGWRVRYQFYGQRALRYSAVETDRFVEEQRAGAAIRFVLGEGQLQVFYESGDDDYFGDIDRHENVEAYGAWVDLHVRRLNLRLGGRTTTFSSDVAASREVKELLGGISLTLGQPGDW